jgi:hypothetical protein
MKHHLDYLEDCMCKTITPDVASETYGINRGTLANMRLAKKGPAYLKIGRKVLYRVSDFEHWLFQNRVQTIDSIEQQGGNT